MYTRIDHVFSYWIFFWFIFYKLDIIKYNPKIFLIIAGIENLYLLINMIYYKNSLKYILLFIFINIFIKVIPLIILWNTEYRFNDFIAGIVLFLIYFGWLYLNGLSIKSSIGKFKDSLDKIKENKAFSPVIHKLFTK